MLRDVSLRVARGQTLGLVGESGAGKSMIGRMVSGLLPPGFRVTQGRLRFQGADLTDQPAAARRALLGRQIAFVPQEPLSALNPLLPIGRQFGEHLARLGVPRGQRAARAATWLDAVHLPDPAAMLRRYPHELSGGQCQRVLIAMAFSSEPSLIVADEPTTALDVITQSRVMQLLKEQQALHGAAVLLITHDLHLAAAICDDGGGDVCRRHGGGRARGGRAADAVPPLHRHAAQQRARPARADPHPALACRTRCPASARWPACRAAASPRAAPPATPPVPRPCRPGARWRRTTASAAPSPASVANARRRRMSGLSAHKAWRTPRRCSTWTTCRCVILAPKSLLGRRGPAVDAVRGVSLRVAPGEFVGLVGESGSGKSSVVRLVMGLAQPTSGQHPAGRRTSPATRCGATTVQFVFQDPQSALNPRRTVLNLVTQVLEVAGHRGPPGRAAPKGGGPAAATPGCRPIACCACRRNSPAARSNG